jgi:hypothetical protein
VTRRPRTPAEAAREIRASIESPDARRVAQGRVRGQIARTVGKLHELDDRDLLVLYGLIRRELKRRGFPRGG